MTMEYKQSLMRPIETYAIKPQSFHHLNRGTNPYLTTSSFDSGRLKLRVERVQEDSRIQRRR